MTDRRRAILAAAVALVLPVAVSADPAPLALAVPPGDWGQVALNLHQGVSPCIEAVGSDSLAPLSGFKEVRADTKHKSIHFYTYQDPVSGLEYQVVLSRKASLMVTSCDVEPPDLSEADRIDSEKLFETWRQSVIADASAMQVPCGGNCDARETRYLRTVAWCQGAGDAMQLMVGRVLDNLPYGYSVTRAAAGRDVKARCK